MQSAPRILYCDDEIVAVHKPAGLKVHRSGRQGANTPTTLAWVRNRLGQWVYPVHRLDQPTSGVLLFARSPEVASVLAAAFAGQRVHKTYLAVVRGHTPPGGLIDHPLVGNIHRPKAGQVPKPARTAFERLAAVELNHPVGRYPTSRYCLLRLHPLTGRMHQIRRHLHHISHPVIGDTTYGDGRHNRFFRSHFDCRRLLLAAVKIAFRHPRTGFDLTITAPPEPSFAAVLRKMGMVLDGHIPPDGYKPVV